MYNLYIGKCQILNVQKMDFDICLLLYQNSCIPLSFPYPLPKVTTILTAISIIFILPTLELDVNRTILYVFLYVWLL